MPVSTTLLQQNGGILGSVVIAIIGAAVVAIVTFVVEPAIPEGISERRDYFFYRLFKRLSNRKIKTRIVIGYSPRNSISFEEAQNEVSERLATAPRNNRIELSRNANGEDVDVTVEFKQGREMMIPETTASQPAFQSEAEASPQLTGIVLELEMEPSYKNLDRTLYDANDIGRDIGADLLASEMERDNSSIICKVSEKPLVSKIMGKIGADHIRGTDENGIEIEFVETPDGNEFRARVGPDTTISQLVSRILEIAVIYA
jgi:hypothetical protein